LCQKTYFQISLVSSTTFLQACIEGLVTARYIDFKRREENQLGATE